MKNLLFAARFLCNFSFIGYLKNRTYTSEIQLNNITNFWKSWLVADNKVATNHILVDALLFHPRYLSQNFSLANLLRKENNADVISLVRYSNDEATKQVSSAFDINQFAYCYKPFNMAVSISAFAHTFNNLRTLGYKKHIGISVFADDMDIGEFIYDEYLRLTNLPTKRRITIDYIAFVYRSLYLYYRYKQIFQKHNITHVVIGHTVYSIWGMLLPAAKSTGLNISFYNWCDATGTARVTLTKQISSAKVRKPGYMKKEYLDILLEKYGTEEISSHFNSLMFNRLSGNVLDKDSANVYKNTEVKSVDSFKGQYELPGRSGHVFIYAHAFVDAVKYSRWTVYSDYFTWLEETLLHLVVKSVTTNVYVKPHPSEHLYACDITAKMLVERINQQYNASFVFLDKKVSNTVVFDLANSIITSCGTINIEASCYGIPVILAGEFGNEKIGYTYPCKTEKSYFETLDRCNNLPRLSERQVLLARIYYCWYMDYMYLSSELFAVGSINPIDAETVSSELFNLNNLYNVINSHEIDNMQRVIAGMSGAIFEDIV